ncbi:unnamed protein product [Clavelina lepadiformis]|uniref:Uncharacterized protein n=1 Tax=Clavelina lepadiformis TaxID=159417 RepID=A0ABP0GGV7_CLALP
MFTFSRSKRYIRYCNSDNRLLSLEIIMKVICAGASKTGTKSLAKALRILGYNEVYDAEEAAEFAFKEWEDIWLGKQTSLDVILDSVYSKNVEAVVDIPHSAFFEQFLERWPEAKVILTLRDEDDWFQSFKSMIDWANKKYWPIHYLRYISPTLNRMLNWQVWLFTTTVVMRCVLLLLKATVLPKLFAIHDRFYESLSANPFKTFVFVCVLFWLNTVRKAPQ